MRITSADLSRGNRDVHLGTTTLKRPCGQPASRLLVIVFAALALFLQAYAAQTHFHTASVQSIQVAGAGKHHQPTGDDTDNCSLCHSFYYGQYLAPGPASWFLPILAVTIIGTASPVSPHYDAVSHSWRGRGPPRI